MDEGMYSITKGWNEPPEHPDLHNDPYYQETKE